MKLHEEISELEQRFAGAPDSRLFLPLADALRRAGELERAVKLCREGLERFPDFNSARVLLGECLADMGELDQAGDVLRESARYDQGNRRIADRLADIERQSAGAARPAAQAPGETAEDSLGAPGDEASWEADLPAGQHPAGEMFITHTLGDIYKMQGHDRKAFEIYSQLAAEGKADREMENKLKDLAARLGEALPESGKTALAKPPAADESGAAVLMMARSEAGQGRFEDRIDTIFHFLLGDTPEHAGLEATAGSPARAAATGASGGFVDMLEEWIEDIRQGN